MLVRYVGPLATVVVVPLDGMGTFIVDRGAVREVSDEVGASLLEQDVWVEAGEGDVE
jgi:hypothetical protein